MPIALLRAEWSMLDPPARLQGLAERHLQLQPIAPNQIDTLDNLPTAPAARWPPRSADPIARHARRRCAGNDRQRTGAPAMAAVSRRHAPIPRGAATRWQRMLQFAALRQATSIAMSRPGAARARHRRLRAASICVIAAGS